MKLDSFNIRASEKAIHLHKRLNLNWRFSASNAERKSLATIQSTLKNDNRCLYKVECLERFAREKGIL